MLIKIIKPVDNDIFSPILAEISKIRWATVIDPRSNNDTFSTSRSIALRKSDITTVSKNPTTISEWSSILDCVDNEILKSRYPSCYKSAEWILEQVNGISMGRVMIVNLLPGGCVKPHIDPGEYFLKYSRFHIPLITNEQVVFSCGENTTEEHMPAGYLCQLNNLDTHMVKNNSDQPRIHIIADIEVPDGNYIF